MSTTPVRPTTILIQPKDAAPKAPPAPSMKVFLELAFRPLYLAGTSWALVAIALWIYTPGLLTAPLCGLAWHFCLYDDRRCQLDRHHPHDR